jgi:hypothetical protein
MHNIPDNATRSRLLDVAEELFSARGYTAVRLRDIDMAALARVSLVESVYAIPRAYAGDNLAALGRQFADMLLDGWLRRSFFGLFSTDLLVELRYGRGGTVVWNKRCRQLASDATAGSRCSNRSPFPCQRLAQTRCGSRSPRQG